MNKARIAMVTAFVIMMVASTLIFGCSGKGKPENREIAALVNDEKIYFDEVNEYYYAFMSAEQQAAMTKADALSLVIEREILYREAEKQGFAATAEEVTDEYNNYLATNKLTESRLGKELASKNSSIAGFKKGIEKRIAISKLLDSKIPRSFTIKHEEAEALYNVSSFRYAGISFEEAEKDIVSFITEQRRKTATESYIAGLKDKARVLIVGVPD